MHVKVAATCYKKNLTKILQWGKVKVCLNFNVYLHYISYVIRREGRYITCLFALCYPCDVYSADVCFCETVDIKSSAILSIKLVKVFHYNFQKLMCYVHRKMFSCSNWIELINLPQPYRWKCLFKNGWDLFIILYDIRTPSYPS